MIYLIGPTSIIHLRWLERRVLHELFCEWYPGAGFGSSPPCSPLPWHLTQLRVFGDGTAPIIAFPFLLSLAIPFYVGFFLNRKQWGWLIPAWFLTIITVIPPLIDRINPDALTALVLYAISLPFLVGYLVDQRCKWALFISAVLGFIGIFSLIESIIHGDILGPIVMLIIALPLIHHILCFKEALVGTHPIRDFHQHRTGSPVGQAASSL